MVLVILTPFIVYTQCRIECPTKSMVILLKKTGKDITNDDELAPSEEHKGLQKEMLGEGRYFRNPFVWDWIVEPQIEIPTGKLGVRTRLYGDNLPEGYIIAWNENEKGIVPDVLVPGRYPINAWMEGQPMRPDGDSYLEHIQLFDPVTVPAGFKGIVTNLSAAIPEVTEDNPEGPNTLLVAKGMRGTQKETLDEKTYYVNPYVTRINLVDCRSQRFNLGSPTERSEYGGIGFPTKDGFWVTIEGIIEYRVKPDEAAQVFVTYNDTTNGDAIDEEIVHKIILPNARSYCRLKGSNHSGRDFISGETRVAFQKDFQTNLAKTCDLQGVEIIQALITKIRPPKKIAEPVKDREVAVRMEEQYKQQILQQESEKALEIQNKMVLQKRALVEAEQQVVEMVTAAEKEKEVAIIAANQRLKVAELQLAAAQDLAAAIMAKGKAEADVIGFDNEAIAAGWKRAIEAFSGNGNEYARFMLLSKLAPSFQDMMVNTKDSPIMDIFESYNTGGAIPVEATPNN